MNDGGTRLLNMSEQNRPTGGNIVEHLACLNGTAYGVAVTAKPRMKIRSNRSSSIRRASRTSRTSASQDRSARHRTPEARLSSWFFGHNVRRPYTIIRRDHPRHHGELPPRCQLYEHLQSV